MKDCQCGMPKWPSTMFCLFCQKLLPKQYMDDVRRAGETLDGEALACAWIQASAFLTGADHFQARWSGKYGQHNA